MRESVGKMVGPGTTPFARQNSSDHQIPALSAIASCSVDKANGKASLAGRQIEAEGDMDLSSAAVAERDDVLTTVDVFASR